MGQFCLQAPKSSFILLDRIQNQSTRLALGAIPALLHEAKVPSLFLRKINLTQQYITKNLSKSNHVTIQIYATIFDTWRQKSTVNSAVF